MKKLFLAADTLIFIIAVSFITSCRSTGGVSHDQIVKSAIELASEYCSNEMYEKALDVYERACGLAEDYRLEYNRAYVLSCLGRNDQAAEVCKKAYEKYPEYFIFRTAMSEYYDIAGKIDEKIALDNSILDEDPYASGIRKRLMQLYNEKKDYSKAFYQAEILWDQGYRDKDVAEVLYSGEPGRWDAVYRFYFPDSKTSQTDLNPKTDLPVSVNEIPEVELVT